MYGISVYDVPVHNKYAFNLYCEDKEALESFGKAFSTFITKHNGKIEIRNDDNLSIDDE